MKDKKENLAQFNKSNILDAAKKLFQKNGLEKTTMDDIAREADYSKSTIYVYFKSKEEIYNNIVYEYFMILKDGLSEVLNKYSSFEARYFSICNMFVEFRKKYPLYFEMLSSKISVKEKDLKKHKVLKDIYNVGEETNIIMKNVVEEAIKNKEIRADINILETTFILQGSIFGLITLAFNKEDYLNLSMNITADVFLQNGFELILNSLLRK